MATVEPTVVPLLIKDIERGAANVELPFRTNGSKYKRQAAEGDRTDACWSRKLSFGGIERYWYMSYCFPFGQATDADMPNTLNSQIVYAILPSTYSDNFTIDPNSGVLTNSSNLDREFLDSKLQGRVELIVTATDKGTPPLSSNVTVIVNIEVSLLQIVFCAGFCWCCLNRFIF